MEATTASLSDVKDIQEIGITISAQNLNPATLNIDFLKSSGIVPADWELAEQPVLSAARSQLSFQNGLKIVAQQRAITFAEAIRFDSSGAISAMPKAPEVAAKYIDVQPLAGYQSLVIAPRIIVNFSSPERTAREFLVNTLLAPGPWREIGQAPAQVSLNFVYALDRCQMTVGLTEVRLRTKTEEQGYPGILFAGSFSYGLAKVPDTERAAKLKERARAWATDLQEFQTVVHQKFLGQGNSGVAPAATIVPPGTVLSAS